MSTCCSVSNASTIELELDTVAAAIGVAREGVRPEGAANLFGAGVDVDAKQQRVPRRPSMANLFRE